MLVSRVRKFSYYRVRSGSVEGSLDLANAVDFRVSQKRLVGGEQREVLLYDTFFAFVSKF